MLEPAAALGDRTLFEILLMARGIGRTRLAELDPHHVNALAQSIALRGLPVPLIVRRVDDGYELERRSR